MVENEGCQIMVFEPSFDEFKNFSEYIKYMESKGAHKAGIAKVIPPKEWSPVRRYNMKRIGEMEIKTPVSQTITGQQGLFQLFNVQKKSVKVKDFKIIADSPRYKGPEGDLETIERKYWKNVTFNPPIYGADVPGSIYDRDVKHWNINNLNTILDTLNTDCKVKILGVNTAYLYFGMWKTTFPWHTEDMNLYSINYLHFGAPKSWYCIPPEHGKRLETLAKGFFSGSARDCSEFMRHKMTIISPHVLRKFSIPVNKITQHEGEFMITFPFGYHSGYNHGFNCAESTNFASERWIDYGKKAKHCECKKDSVKIDMDLFIHKFQPEEWRKLQQDRRKERQVDTHNNRKTARANYSSDSKDTTTEESDGEVGGSDKEEDEIDEDEEDEDSENSRSEDSEEITDSDKDDKKVDENNETKASSERDKSTKKKSKSIDLMKRRSARQKKLQHSKRHPIHKQTIDEETINDKEDEKTESKYQKFNNTTNGTVSIPQLSTILHRVWNHLPPNKQSEHAFNKQLSETEAKCAVCVYFSQTDADLLRSGSSKSDVNKRHTLSQLKSGKLLVTELCFAINNSEETAMETAFNLMFGDTDHQELNLLICTECHVAVHSSCYGVNRSDDAADDVNTKWYCDKCRHLQQVGQTSSTKWNQELLELDIKCCLCCIRGGALKQTTDGQWCHIICAITFPEVLFENKKDRGPINISELNIARKKLNCIYCSNLSKSSTDHGACVQCKCGKCAAPFHVTCSFHHGVPLYLGDWPILIETLCPKHVKQKVAKIEKRTQPEVSSGDVVVAKHKNGRYYKGKVLDVTMMLYYKVVFDDKSFCFDLPPEDIQGVDARTNVIAAGVIVNILWPDSITYRAEVTGHWYEAMCQVRFEDTSILNVKRSDLYLEQEEIPKKVKSKLSYATETANKLFLAESLRTGRKRARIGTRRCASTHKKL